jgi:hypothetical protein
MNDNDPIIRKTLYQNALRPSGNFCSYSLNIRIDFCGYHKKRASFLSFGLSSLVSINIRYPKTLAAPAKSIAIRKSPFTQIGTCGGKNPRITSIAVLSNSTRAFYQPTVSSHSQKTRAFSGRTGVGSGEMKIERCRRDTDPLAPFAPIRGHPPVR